MWMQAAGLQRLKGATEEQIMFNSGKVGSASSSKSAVRVSILLTLLVFGLLRFTAIMVVHAQTASDPGVRGGPPGAGNWFTNLTPLEEGEFQILFSNFVEQEEVTTGGGGDVLRTGLGPRFDSNSCNSCHAYPAVGGSSPPQNQLFSVYQLNGAKNEMPFFETPNGPTLVARFPFQTDLKTPDGHVHALFVITGRSDAGACNIAQPDFVTAAATNNLIFRNTTPTFGGGMLEVIKNSDLINNGLAVCNSSQNQGVCGHPNLQPDGSVGRFGWKAQNRSLLTFSAEAYNVEEGVTNLFFPNEIDETPGCVLNPLPEDQINFDPTVPPKMFPGDPERFAITMRFMAPPAPGTCPGGNAGSCTNGLVQFTNVGCALCHTQSFTTPPHVITPLSNAQAFLYSDVLVHHMGPCNADNVAQGSAAGDEWRTTPLWGIGQRVFFMSDGRTSDIVQAIEDHSCAGNSQYPASEANQVITNFNALSAENQQDLINFLRSL
jgi:CxxC motif-containing protein (DUF1111 family)